MGEASSLLSRPDRSSLLELLRGVTAYAPLKKPSRPREGISFRNHVHKKNDSAQISPPMSEPCKKLPLRSGCMFVLNRSKKMQLSSPPMSEHSRKMTVMERFYQHKELE